MSTKSRQRALRRHPAPDPARVDHEADRELLGAVGSMILSLVTLGTLDPPPRPSRLDREGYWRRPLVTIPLIVCG